MGQIVDEQQWEEYIVNYESLDFEGKRKFLVVFNQELVDAHLNLDHTDPVIHGIASTIRNRMLQLNELQTILDSQDPVRIAQLEEIRLRREAELQARQAAMAALKASLGPDFA